MQSRPANAGLEFGTLFDNARLAKLPREKREQRVRFPPGQHWSLNVEAVAYLDLDGKPGFKMALHNVGARWFFYVAHLWEPGWSIVDVTDAANPRYLRFIPGPPNTWTLQIQIADGRMITALEKIPKEWSPPPDPAVGNEEGFLIWEPRRSRKPEATRPLPYRR